MSNGIPILDLRLFETKQEQFVEALGQGFTEFGFCGIRDHGIPDEVIAGVYRVIQEFFALPVEVKSKYHVPGIGGARGYTGFGVETAKDSQHPDLKEFWHVGREIPDDHPMRKFMYKNVWPQEVPDFKACALALYSELENLGNTILQAIALFLKLPQEFFTDKTQVGNSILRPIHYPPIESDGTLSIRSGQHEDINLITLLVGSNAPGLEILSRKGEWIPVTTIEGTIVCNISDMLQRLTNHLLPSTTHRVVNPAGEWSRRSRYSIPFFLHPNPDYLIKTLPSCVDAQHPNRYPEPILANDYLQQRLREIKLY